MMKNSSKGVLFALISSATFGLIPLFTLPVIGSNTLNSISILFYRLFFATIGIGLTVILKHNSFNLKKKEIPKILFLGLFYAATSLFLLLSYSYIPSGISTTIHFLYPVSVSLLMILFFKEKCRLTTIAACILALIGVGLISWTSANMSGDSTLGLIYVLISVLTYGIYIVGVNKIGVSHINSFVLTFYVLLSGVIMVGARAITSDGLMPITNFDVALNLILLALVSTVISNLTLVLAVKHIGSTVTAILGSLEPLVAVIVGIIVFNENIELRGYLGIALILISVIMIIMGTKKKS